MSAAAVILELRPGGPFRAEVAHLGAHAGVVRPAVAADIGAREPGLMRRQIEQRDLTLAVRGEFRDVVDDPVVEGERSFLDEAPHRRHRQDLGVGK